MERKLLITNNNRVASVGAAVEASNKIIAVLACGWLDGECVIVVSLQCLFAGKAYFFANTSASLPLPSSPHCAPSTAHTRASMPDADAMPRAPTPEAQTLQDGGRFH